MNNGHTLDVESMLKPAWEAIKPREELLQAWLDSRQALDSAKAAENALRVQVVAAFPFDANDAEGTQNIDLNRGYKLKVVKKLNYTLNNKENATDIALDKLEALSVEGKFIAERLVKWKPDLSISEYRKLDPKMRGIIDEVLTVTPGLPTLELVEPKMK